MTAEAVVLVAATTVFLIAVVSGRLHRVWLTEPMVAMGLGLGAGLALLDDVALESPAVLVVLELTLALVLFTDASRIDLTRLRAGYSWPLRMLTVATPLMIALGAVFAGWYLGLPLGIALLLGVILAPTDAALAEPVLQSRLVPPRVRQTLNVESGLNDGLAVPALLLALGLAEAEAGAEVGEAIALVVSQLGIGTLGGVVLGWLGATLIGKGTEAGWMNPLHQKISAVALALGGFAAVQLLGGSGFVATFVAGGLMAHLIRPRCEFLYDFAEAEGHSLVILAFFVFGLGPLTELAERGVPAEALVVAIVSLVLLRPAAVALSLFGQRLHGSTVVFLGWFGPRGLATVVFGLLVVEELGVIDSLIVDTMTTTVAVSILAHGLSAVPMARWLASRTETMAESMPEMGAAFPHPMRRG